MFRLARNVITLLILLGSVSSVALGCGSDDFDHDQELAAIKRALPAAQLTAPERAELDNNLRIASVSREHLGLKGLMLQGIARGKALEKLGIARIPLPPEREFAAIRDRLKGLSKPNESEVEAQRLRDEAQKLWDAREYNRSREALSKALKLLNIWIPYFRC
jgi:hypothetical protein